MSRFTLAVCAVALLSAPVIVSASASADDQSPVAVPPISLADALQPSNVVTVVPVHQLLGGTDAPKTPMSANEMKDLRRVAAATGESMTTLVRKQVGVTALGRAVNKIDRQFPGRVLQSGIVPETTGLADFYVQIAGTSTPEIVDALNSIPYSVDLQSGLPITRKALEVATVDMANASIKEPAIRPDTFIASIASDGQSIEASFARADGASDSEIAATAERLRAVGQSRPSVPVTVVFTETHEAPLEFLTTIKGGKQMTQPQSQGGRGLCTSGFTASRGGVLGVITAAHCPDTLGFTGDDGALGTAVAASGESKGSVDIQFHATRGSNPTVATFMASDSEERPVQGKANPPQGSSICLHGITTSQACGSVTNAVTTYVVGSQTFAGGFDTSAVAYGGDSGGPMYIGSSARGFVSAGNGAHTLGVLISKAANNLGSNLLGS